MTTIFNDTKAYNIPLRMRVMLFSAIIGMLAGLFILGAQPIAVGLFPSPVDKFAHAGFFSSLTILLWYGTNRSNLMAVFASVVILGVLDEWHQVYLPGRSADFMDLSTDIAAAGTIILFFYLIQRRRTV